MIENILSPEEYDELTADDIVHIRIRPGKNDPSPAHVYLNSQLGTNGAWNYYFLPWRSNFPNDVPKGKNFRYGEQAVELWGDKVEVVLGSRTED